MSCTIFRVQFVYKFYVPLCLFTCLPLSVSLCHFYIKMSLFLKSLVTFFYSVRITCMRMQCTWKLSSDKHKTVDTYTSAFLPIWTQKRLEILFLRNVFIFLLHSHLSSYECFSLSKGKKKIKVQ